MTAGHDMTGSAALEKSVAYARRVQALPTLALPDEWYPAQGATPTQRLQAAYRAMGAGKPATVDELLTRYDNQGAAFCHTVWLNRPLNCPGCKGAGADGFSTVVSLRNQTSVTLTALEMHMALNHQAAFPDAKLQLLDRVFAPAAAQR